MFKLSVDTVAGVIRAVREKRCSPEQILEELFDAMQQDEQSPLPLNAVIWKEAKNLCFAKVKNLNRDLPLAGVPVLLKDNMSYTGFPLTCASKILEGYVSPYTATFVQKLQDHGAILYAMANMDEFAMGSTNETSVYGPVRSPFQREYVAGGSSGGSAAAVGGNLAICALGSDTGGSIRQPATYCGAVGLKPTYGRISRYGLCPLASSLDQAGPITKTVEDAAILLEYMSGWDPRDATSSKKEVPSYVKSLEDSLHGKTIAILQDSCLQGMQEDIKKSYEAVLQWYAKQGCKIVQVDLPSIEFAVRTYFVTCMYEISSNMSRFEGVRYGKRCTEYEDLEDYYAKTRDEGFGKEVKRRLLLGTMLSMKKNSQNYETAQRVRVMMQKEFSQIFELASVMILPLAGTTPSKVGANYFDTDPTKIYLNEVFTVFSNLTGGPCISLPCGIDAYGVPNGFQILGNFFQEAMICNFAHMYQKDHGILRVS